METYLQVTVLLGICAFIIMYIQYEVFCALRKIDSQLEEILNQMSNINKSHAQLKTGIWWLLVRVLNYTGAKEQLKDDIKDVLEIDKAMKTISKKGECL